MENRRHIDDPAPNGYVEGRNDAHRQQRAEVVRDDIDRRRKRLQARGEPLGVRILRCSEAVRPGAAEPRERKRRRRT
jgi:hypothetical protein